MSKAISHFEEGTLMFWNVLRENHCQVKAVVHMTMAFAQCCLCCLVLILSIIYQSCCHRHSQIMTLNASDNRYSISFENSFVNYPWTCAHIRLIIISVLLCREDVRSWPEWVRFSPLSEWRIMRRSARQILLRVSRGLRRRRLPTRGSVNRNLRISKTTL